MLTHYNNLSNKMDPSLLVVRYMNHKYIVVERRVFMTDSQKLNIIINKLEFIIQNGFSIAKQKLGIEEIP